jgi:hypothetical protein
MVKYRIFKSKKLSSFKNVIHGISSKGRFLFRQGLRLKIIENRRKFFSQLGIKLKNVVMMEQVHGTKIKIVKKKDRRKGVFSKKTYLKKTDALITEVPQVFLATFNADCVPVLFYDPQNKIVSMVHAGWKGVAKNIGEIVVKEMKNKFNADPQKIIAYLGPAIGVCCYGISQKKDRNERIKKLGQAMVKRKNKIYLDLKWALSEQLLKAGLKPKNIEVSLICTVCRNKDLASHYKEGKNRQTSNLAVIGLKY